MWNSEARCASPVEINTRRLLCTLKWSHFVSSHLHVSRYLLALENVKEGVNFNSIFITFTTFPADINLPKGYSYYKKVVSRRSFSMYEIKCAN